MGLFLFLCFSQLMAGPLHKIVVFGDSFSDTGNFYEYMKHQFPPSPPYYNGRFSDGPVWVERVLEHYYPNDIEAHHVNCAFSGSGVGSEEEDDDEDIEDEVMFNLGGQVKYYFQQHENKADASSLYVIWIGANNYLIPGDDLDEEIEFTIIGIKRSLRQLIQRGAKHIMVMSLPDLGASPKARKMKTVEQLSYSTAQHNQKLMAEIETFRTLYSDIQWFYFDVSQLFAKAIQSPERYGFTNVTDECKDTLNACDTYLFFDTVHPSGHTHAELAGEVISYFDKAGVKFG